jgi:hypothetical protein
MSAWIVWSELQYTVITYNEGNDGSEWVEYDMSKHTTYDEFKKVIRSRKFKYENHIETFCSWYPDASRQEERLNKGLIILDCIAKLFSQDMVN